MYLTFVVVEIQGDPTVFLILPVFFYLVEFFKNFDQVAGVFLAHVFDPEVIDDETEIDGSPVMFPEPWRVVILAVPIFGESFFK